MTNINPVRDYILIEPLTRETTTASGIVIPDTVKEKPQEGKIVAMGPGRFNEDGDQRIPFEVKLGDVVMYKKWSGTEVKVDGKDMILVKEEDILAVIGTPTQDTK